MKITSGYGKVKHCEWQEANDPFNFCLSLLSLLYSLLVVSPLMVTISYYWMLSATDMANAT